MMSVALSHIVYASSDGGRLEVDDLRKILHSAQKYNAENSITGLLVHSMGSFFQVLEGESESVISTFTRILADPRHSNVVRIIEEPIAKRDFGEWRMGFLDIEESELRSMKGVGDALPPDGTLADLPAGRAKKLLAAFATGRWRGRLKSSVP